MTLSTRTSRPSPTTPDISECAAAWLLDGAVSQQVADFVRPLALDDAQVRRLAADSYWHANGFMKFLLWCADDDAFRLRLHVWPRDPGRQQNVHDHRFDFWSVVLKGSITNRIWQLGRGECLLHYKYFPRAGRTSYTMRRGERYELGTFQSFTTGEQEGYYLAQNDLHTIACDADTVTLLLEDRRNLKPFANVFCAPEAVQNEVLDSPALTAKQYRDELLRIATRLST